MSEEYPKAIGWETCPDCGAKARLELTSDDAPDVLVLCTANADRNYRQQRPPAGSNR
jgi:hypothetical protein